MEAIMCYNVLNWFVAILVLAITFQWKNGQDISREQWFHSSSWLRGKRKPEETVASKINNLLSVKSDAVLLSEMI